MPLSIPTVLRPLLQRPVAVFGAGVSGRAVCRLLQVLGAEFRLYDATATEACPCFDAQAAQDCSLVVFSPGFEPEHPWLKEAAASGCLCLAELDLASLCWQGRVVAVTGTNGKTTLVEFLTHALRCAGEQAWATGNIGAAFCDLVVDRAGGGAQDFALCEVSSFQAEMLWHFRADALLWTNLAEDHLERHGSLHRYALAKCALFPLVKRGQIFLGPSLAPCLGRLGISTPDASVVVWPSPERDSLLRGGVFECRPQLENFDLALAWWASEQRDPSLLFEAASTFKLGAHRLHLVTSQQGVEWWNDSKATNFHAVEAALTRLGDRVLLIAGGKAKGGDIFGFVQRVSKLGVRHLFLLGETAEILAKACAASGLSCSTHASLEQACAQAAQMASSGDRVLLSPGFASFDMFRGYAHRGQVFETWLRHHFDLTSTDTPSSSI